MKSDYLGRWFKNNPESDEDGKEIEIINVIGDNAIAASGEKIPLINLDFGEEYWKMNPLGNAEISSLNSIASNHTKTVPNTEIINDPLGIKSSNYRNDVIDKELSNNVTTSNKVDKKKEEFIINDPIQTLIESIIKIQQSKNKTSEFPVTINLKFDFDILYVIKVALETGASDLEILSHIMKYLPINVDDIKKSILMELLPDSESDVNVVLENREQEFNDTLYEELQ